MTIKFQVEERFFGRQFEMKAGSFRFDYQIPGGRKIFLKKTFLWKCFQAYRKVVRIVTRNIPCIFCPDVPVGNILPSLLCPVLSHVCAHAHTHISHVSLCVYVSICMYYTFSGSCENKMHLYHGFFLLKYLSIYFLKIRIFFLIKSFLLLFCLCCTACRILIAQPPPPPHPPPPATTSGLPGDSRIFFYITSV